MKIIFDCDPGIDDAIAIIAALNSSDIEILAISTVNGNVGSKMGALNTLQILNYFSRLSIPVIRGSALPLSKKPYHAREIHGKTGIGEVILPLPVQIKPGKKNLPDFITELVKNHRKREISIVATGPLTNIAKLYIGMPWLTDYIDKLCIMGGSFGIAEFAGGNVNPFAEFNFYCDPEAADVVIRSTFNNIQIVGLDVTHDPRCIIDSKNSSEILSFDSPSARLVGRLLQFPLMQSGFFHLHDVFAVAMLEQPWLFNYLYGSVEIIRKGRRRGQSVFTKNEKRSPVRIASGVNVQEFMKYVVRRLQGKN